LLTPSNSLRALPVGKVAAQFLQEYLRQVRPVLLKRKKNPDGSLFLISTNTLRKRFQRHSDAAHLGDNLHRPQPASQLRDRDAARRGIGPARAGAFRP
jgi:site-specific recombinase XerD